MAWLIESFKESVAAQACLSPRPADTFLHVEVTRAAQEHRRHRVPRRDRREEPPGRPAARGAGCHGVLLPGSKKQASVLDQQKGNVPLVVRPFLLFTGAHRPPTGLKNSTVMY